MSSGPVSQSRSQVFEVLLLDQKPSEEFAPIPVVPVGRKFSRKLPEKVIMTEAATPAIVAIKLIGDGGQSAARLQAFAGIDFATSLSGSRLICAGAAVPVA